MYKAYNDLGGKILKVILKEIYFVEIWTGLNWLSTGPNEGIVRKITFLRHLLQNM